MAYLRFHGAAREVTGSMHLLEWNGHHVALDCGLFQGRRAEAREKNVTYPCPPRDMTAVILSHAHIDHSGKLPRLVRDGFEGPIFATPATRDLAEVMLADSAHIQFEDAAYFNKKRARAGEAPIEPLYTVEDAERAVRQMRAVPYEQPFEAAPGVVAQFHDAGHLLGSAGVRLELSGNGSSRTVVYTGDVGRFHMPILRDPAPLPACDYLITESTYGGRRTGEPADLKMKLAKILNETFDRGGKVIVPAFAVGRTQSLVYSFHQLVEEGALHTRAPLFIDSPLAVNTTAVFARHPECYDSEARTFNAANGGMLHCDRCHYVASLEESKALHARRGPLMVLSASGMCETGRILHHLKNNCEDPKNTILIVGFQAAHTLGRRIVEKAKQIKIFGELYRVRARVEVINGFSSHADADELRHMLAPLAGPCRHAFVVHGEYDQSAALQQWMQQAGFSAASIPEAGERIELD